MYHYAALSSVAKADPRPASAVSTGVGLVGLAGLAVWVAVARWYGMDGPYAALVSLVACGAPMVLWSLLVDRVHRNPSTGIDWSDAKPLQATLDVSLTKLAGLWLTWGAIAAIYVTFRFYWEGNFIFAMGCFTYAAPVLFAASIPWVMWSDRYLIEPRDGAWHLGAWALSLNEPIEKDAIHAHLRAWAVKGFFAAFMLAIVPPNLAEFIQASGTQLLRDPVALASWLVTLMFLIDVCFATVGYLLTFRALDSHIRSASPYAAGWAAALICYPPFVLMGRGGPLDYSVGTSDFTHWLGGHPALMTVVAFTLVGLTAIYAWATVAFGLRFSNLTNRGILTHGPYAFTRHPAYLSKNIFWLLSTIPVLSTTGSWADASRNTVIMLAVAGVYYWRAKTEEAHLSLDPAYRDYSAWMERNGVVPRFFARLLGRQ